MTIDLRQAPFVGWITDLSVQDPYYVLPIIMGATMVIQQKITPTTMDPTQAKIMLVLPVFMTFLFVNFPAGLVLYWLTNNVLTIGQQVLTDRLFAIRPFVTDPQNERGSMLRGGPEDTICAIATPAGEGGIGIVRLSGPQALRIADKIVQLRSGQPLASVASHTLSPCRPPLSRHESDGRLRPVHTEAARVFRRGIGRVHESPSIVHW